MSADHYTYRVTWSPEAREYLALCVELPSLSWLAATPTEALLGIPQAAAEAVADMQSNGEPIPATQQLFTIHGSKTAAILKPEEGAQSQSRPKQRLPLVAFLQGLGLDEIEIEREKPVHPDRRSTST
jgi:predicted RNase H-like HicB family nuclease